MRHIKSLVFVGLLLAASGASDAASNACPNERTSLPRNAEWDHLDQLHIAFDAIKSKDVDKVGKSWKFAIKGTRSDLYLAQVGPSPVQSDWCVLEFVGVAGVSHADPRNSEGPAFEVQLGFNCSTEAVHFSKHEQALRAAFRRVRSKSSVTVVIPFFSFEDDSPWWMPRFLRPSGPNEDVSVADFFTQKSSDAQLQLRGINGNALSYLGSGPVADGTCAPTRWYVMPAEKMTPSAVKSMEFAASEMEERAEASSLPHGVASLWAGLGSDLGKVTMYDSSTSLIRKCVYGTLIAMVLAAGFFVARAEGAGWLSLPFFLGHLFAPLLPWIARWCGWVSCADAMPWGMHFFYAVMVAGAAPFLCGDQRKCWEGEVPVLGLRGSIFHIFYYVVTLLASADQYLDNAAAVIAFSCGWDKAWMLPVVFGGGFVIQMIVVGLVEPELASLAALGTNLDGQAIATQRKEDKDGAAALAISRFFTENCPQGGLQYLFCKEVKPSKIVLLSISISMLMGIKAAVTGMHYFFTGNGYKRLETPISLE